MSNDTDKSAKLGWLADEHDLGFTRKMAAEHLRCGVEHAAYVIRQAISDGIVDRVKVGHEIRYCRPERAAELAQVLEDIQDRRVFLDPKQTVVKATEAKKLDVCRSASSVFAWAEEMAQ